LDIGFIKFHKIGPSKGNKKLWKIKKLEKEKSVGNNEKYFLLFIIQVITWNLSRNEIDNIFFNETINLYNENKIS
jgi:hypothetical protein